MNQRVMILDDASERPQILSEALRAAGYNVIMVTATNYAELQVHLNRLRPEVIVFDDEVIVTTDGHWPVADLAA